MSLLGYRLRCSLDKVLVRRRVDLDAAEKENIIASARIDIPLSTPEIINCTIFVVTESLDITYALIKFPLFLSYGKHS